MNDVMAHRFMECLSEQERVPNLAHYLGIPRAMWRS